MSPSSDKYFGSKTMKEKCLCRHQHEITIQNYSNIPRREYKGAVRYERYN